MGHIADRCRPRDGRLDDQNLSGDQASSAASQLQGESISAAPRPQRGAARCLGLDRGQDPDVSSRRRPDRERRLWRRSLRAQPEHGAGRQIECVAVAELAVVPGDPADELPELPGRPAPVVDHVELRSHESPTAVVRMRGDQLGLADLHRHTRVGPHLWDQEERRDDAARGGVLDHGHIAVRSERRVRRLEQITRPLFEHRCRKAFVGVHGPVEVDQLGTIVQPAGAQDEAVTEVTWQRAGIDAIRHENHRPP